MCPKTCACRNSKEESSEQFIEIWEELFTLEEEARLHKELDFGTENPQP